MVRTSERIYRTLRAWLLFAVVFSVVTVMVYSAVQQDIRQSANDPQIQMAEDAAAALDRGAAPPSLVPSSSIDIAQSLAPYIVIFDETGRPLVSTATLHGSGISLPQGVFLYTKQHFEDRFTWQPEPGMRSAAVVTYYRSAQSSGFVLAGRSMREVEERESNLMSELFLGWISFLVFFFVCLYIFY
jgi:hypothetical protein